MFYFGHVNGHFEKSETGRDAEKVEDEDPEESTEAEKDDLHGVPDEE